MKILVAGHGELPDALVGSARMIGGELAEVTSICLNPGDTPQELRDRMLALLTEFPAELILTDLAGGTPDNVANIVVKGGTVPSISAIVAGVSLPLLLEFALSGAKVEDLKLNDVIAESAAVVRYNRQEN